MRRLIFMAWLSVLMVVQTNAYASREAVLIMSEFRVTSSGIDGSGPVTVSGQQAGEKFISLSVEAFGRTVKLSAGQLASLEGSTVNGIQISYETGYRELSGRTVYVVLSKGFTSGVQRTRMISINEQGQVRIDGNTFE